MRRSPSATTRKQAAETLRGGSPGRRGRKEVSSETPDTDTDLVDEVHEGEVFANEHLDNE
ncbi:hypothetical protein [Lichenicoccus roseus]|uniref:Uncharacterized protein n=1 Tax=Lichenicoccus roseus TaxID=2683649 RepID=A0A5R9J665_9PROT|nr:hypothetical protein [Lichenicoccus roseus]TLU73110.1 hypothetical protein FE263_06675 [Lichenicoccus roseus]